MLSFTNLMAVTEIVTAQQNYVNYCTNLFPVTR